jgi:hypothetical protein
MPSRFLEPSAAGIRKPTDAGKNNGKIINPPRYAEHGGLTGPGKIVGDGNTLTIKKPGGS